VLHHAVEQIAMHHPEPAAGGGHVDGVLAHGDVAESHAVELARHFVVVAGHVDHFRALARLAQQLLHHVVVALRPVPATAQLPAVDDVAYQIEHVGLVVLQEIEQIRGLATGRAEMDIGQPDGAVAMCGRFRSGGGAVARFGVEGWGGGSGR
jgi:hypothetical protein